MASTKTPESRRAFLGKALWLVPATVSLQACDVSAPAATVRQGPAGLTGADYKPGYLSEVEWRFVNALTDRFIPADAEGPGAVASGVPEFIDRQMATPYGHGGLWYMHGPFPEAVPEMGYQFKLTPREIVRLGIAAVNGQARSQHQRDFADLDHARQEAMMTALEHGKVVLADVPAQTFFSFMLGLTREGFFSDPLHGGNRDMNGWELIGFPGARADFMDFANQNGARYPLPPVSINEANPKA